MSCNNCGDKTSLRHKPTVVVSGDIDSKPTTTNTINASADSPVTGKSFTPENQITPHEAFVQAKSLDFEVIINRQRAQQKRAIMEVESMYQEMTDAMRQFHIVSLVAVANYENLAMPGVSPDQAVVALKEALDREDFIKINELYPQLKSNVALRYEELMSKRITL